MRIKQLILHAFGQFSDKTLDLGDKPKNGSDFHIFYGANEAGKTTIMEAWLRFLFGLPLQDSYAFKYKRRDLSISALLQIQGDEIALTRIPKGHGSVLRDAQNQEIDENVLTAQMGALSDAEEYRNRLCLDDKSLERGGEDIIQSKGRMGELLFAAGSGLTGLSQKLEQRAAEIAEIHKAHGKNTLLAEKLRAYEDVKQQLEESRITPAGYDQLKQRLSDAAADETRLKKQADDLYDRLNHLQEARRCHEQTVKFGAEFAARTAEMQDIAAKLGVETQGADAAALYADLRPLALEPAKLQDLRERQNQAALLAGQIAAQKQELAPLAEKYQQKQQQCALLTEALPAAELRLQLAELMRNMAADDVEAAYRLAEAGKKQRQDQVQKALLNLTVKGREFTELPPSPLTAQEAAVKLKQIERAESELAQYSKNIIAAEAKLGRIEAQLTALRDGNGQRIIIAEERA